MNNDLISRAALLLVLPENLHGIIQKAPSIKPSVVCNITGGMLQGASADYPVDVYTLDFDVNGDRYVMIDGSEAYLGQEGALIEPEFVRQVIEAEEIDFETGEPVDAG